MVAIRLTLSCGNYDRTRPLIERAVPTAGLDLMVIPLPSAERHTRFVTRFEFDVCELQIAQYFGLKSRRVSITALPVFHHRRFNHSCVMVHLDSDIARPEQEEERALLGPDPWPYSIEKNRVVPETLLDYAAEQELTERRLDIKEIFAPGAEDERKH
jgi:hypothetical protein